MSPNPLISWKLQIDQLTPELSIRMIHLPRGVFTMGDNQGKYDDEKPEHEVEVSSFYLGQYPVNQALWQHLMGDSPTWFKGNRRPVEQSSWKDIQEFLEKLNLKLELGGEQAYRLPTEAEWEYAARAGKRSVYAGSESLDRVGWYRDNSQRRTHEVGLKAPNEWGLYDMTGNVREWCQDWFGGKYYQRCLEKGTVPNPRGPESGEDRVLRGGSWGNDPGSLSGCFSRQRPPRLPQQ